MVLVEWVLLLVGKRLVTSLNITLVDFVKDKIHVMVELMWDQMFRASINYGRKGLPIQAISAVDLALWDLLGKLRKEPVYMLLGGATKPFLPMYTTYFKARGREKT